LLRRASITPPETSREHPFCFTVPEKFSIIENNNLKSKGDEYEAE
jgi:hypothetical protein